MTKQFKPLLAATVDPEQLKNVSYPVMASPKLDGIRSVVINAQLVSRNLKAIRNAHVQSLLGMQALNGLDGELIVGEPSDPLCYRNTSTGIMSGDGFPEFKFHVFDVIPEFIGADMRGFEWRLDWVKQWLHNHQSYAHLIEVVPHKIILNETELLEYEEQNLAAGYEGVMLRSLTGSYKYGRSTLKEGTLLKLKRFTDAEFEIVGFQERMHNANEAKKDALGRTERSTHKENMVGRGDLGALEVRGNGGTLNFTVGSGFNDALRKEIWDNKEKYLGKWVKVKYFSYGQYDVPRFPTYLGLRDAIDMGEPE